MIRSRGLGEATVSALAGVPYVALLIGAAVILRPGPAPDAVLVLVMASFFAALIGRLILAAVVRPTRRPPLLVLAGALAAWLLGAIVLIVGGPPGEVDLPAPGELLLLVANAGLITFLLLDARSVPRYSRQQGQLRGRTFEAVVSTCQTICVAGLVMVSPIGGHLAPRGVSLLLALTHPLLDLMFATIVIIQLMLKVRPRSRWTAVLFGAIGLFMAADLSVLASVSSQRVELGPVIVLGWLLGLHLLVLAACRPGSAPEGEEASGTATAMVTAGVIAVLALAFQPSGDARLYVVLPALATLVAVGARMVQAQRAAHDAAEAFRLARTDDLTGLLNRRGLTAEIAGHFASPGTLGLVLVDLDGFKEINDSLGHAAGDAVLRLLADRLRRAFPREVHVCRLGGDEFALAVPEHDDQRLLAQAGQALAQISAPARIDDVDLVMTASVGVAVRDESDRDVGDLLRRADIAMYQAKHQGIGIMLYDPERDHFSRNRLSMADELRRGIEAGQLLVWYQPQVSSVARAMVGVEALVRWQHPARGLIPPDEFLPVARRTGLMAALSEAVMETMLQDLQQWTGAGLDVYASLNLAPPELLGGRVLNRLYALLGSTGLPASRIVVEITEDSLLTDPKRARLVLEEIHQHGLQVSIDDFGTGYSSLAYLRELPVQELKIDRVFVKSVLEDPRSRMIVESINHLAHGLNMHTVAEGVEDEETARMLTDIGVDVQQGYWFARPMPEHELQTWISQHGSQASARRRPETSPGR